MAEKSVGQFYKGIHYRSRTEARWKIFFDTVGIHSVYEPKEFLLPPKQYPYNPDFEISWEDNTNLPMVPKYIEMKPFEPTAKELWKLQQLSILLRSYCYFFINMPSNPFKRNSGIIQIVNGNVHPYRYGLAKCGNKTKIGSTTNEPCNYLAITEVRSDKEFGYCFNCKEYSCDFFHPDLIYAYGMACGHEFDEEPNTLKEEKPNFGHPTEDVVYD